MVEPHHYQILYEVLRDIYLMDNEEELAGYILIQISKALQTNGGTIFLAKGDHLHPMAATGIPLEELRKYEFKIGEGIAGAVAKTKAPLTVENAKTDPRFSDTVDVKTGFVTRNITAAPILYGQEVRGVIEFLNKIEGPFKPTDQEFITILGKVAGLALERIHLNVELAASEKLKQAVIESLAAGMIIVDRRLNLLIANSRAYEILGRTTAQLYPGASLAALQPDYPAIIDCVEKVLVSRAAIRRQEGLFNVNGAPKKIGYSCVPVGQKESAPFGAALLFQDITEYQ
ncbi:MAG: GAF domain-containing protein [Elusimicrobia bacterium]|nr:GAF domain-containing protein [Elusimicrobiota bacterium]